MEPDFDFKPITDGLGFHPFSDGLPYAPLKKPMGTGAESAGRPIPSPQMFKPQAPARTFVPTMTVAKNVAEIAPVKTATEAPVEQNMTAPLWRRCAAWTFDLVLWVGLWTGTLVLLLKLNHAPLNLLFDSTVLPFVMGSALLSFVLLLPLVEAVAKRSIGKLIFGLGFEATTGEMLFRALAYWFEIGFLGLGLVWVFFDRRHRPWHDILSGTSPVMLSQK